jgi:hypothetical protein
MSPALATKGASDATSIPITDPRASELMMLVGKLSMIAPSTRTSPDSTHGGTIPGIAVDARIARHNGPL